MTDEERFLEFWTPTLGAEEAMRSWRVKEAGMRLSAPMVQGDIQTYQSQIDGTYITSRSQHREHLKRHNCIEIGNETKHLKAYGQYDKPDPRLKETIIRAVNEKLK